MSAAAAAVAAASITDIKLTSRLDGQERQEVNPLTDEASRRGVEEQAVLEAVGAADVVVAGKKHDGVLGGWTVDLG